MNQTQGVPAAHILVNTLRLLRFGIYNNRRGFMGMCGGCQSHRGAAAASTYQQLCNDLFFFLGNAV